MRGAGWHAIAHAIPSNGIEGIGDDERVRRRKSRTARKMRAERGSKMLLSCGLGGHFGGKLNQKQPSGSTNLSNHLETETDGDFDPRCGGSHAVHE